MGGGRLSAERGSKAERRWRTVVSGPRLGPALRRLRVDGGRRGPETGLGARLCEPLRPEPAEDRRRRAPCASQEAGLPRAPRMRPRRAPGPDDRV